MMHAAGGEVSTLVLSSGKFGKPNGLSCITKVEGGQILVTKALHNL